jgi:hypothetical protein
MTGKEKCEFLKEIRCKMAVANGIPYKPRECHHEGDCLGTCPLCEVESQYILEELKKKESEGKEIQADSYATEVLELLSCNHEAMEEEDNQRRHLLPLLGLPDLDFLESDKKSGLWERFMNWLRGFDGSFEGEVEIEDVREISKLHDDISQGQIPSNYWLHKKPEPGPEPEPDITWNLDEDDPIISNPERIISRDTITKNATPEDDSE